jgi:hypothetical protein
MANPIYTAVQSLSQFDLPEWKRRVQHHAAIGRIEQYLLLDLDAYDATKDPYLALRPPTLPQTPLATRNTPGPDPGYALALYQLQSQEYKDNLLSAQNLSRFIADSVPPELRTDVLTTRTPAAAYHAIIAKIKALSPQIVQQLEYE